MTGDTARHLAARRRATSRYPTAIEKNSGIALCVDAAMVAPRILQAIEDGWYEDAEADTALKLVRPGDAVLELGAGLGFISTRVCLQRRVGSYLAVEADQRLLPYLRETHRINGVHGVEVLNTIVTSDPSQLAAGRAGFRLEPEFWESHATLPGEAADVSVEAIPLARLVAERAVSVIIADIEGGEARLFGNADLGPVRHVLLEVHPQLLAPGEIANIFTALHAQALFYDTEHSSGRLLTFTRGLSPASRSAP